MLKHQSLGARHITNPRTYPYTLYIHVSSVTFDSYSLGVTQTEQLSRSFYQSRSTYSSIPPRIRSGNSWPCKHSISRLPQLQAKHGCPQHGGNHILRATYAQPVWTRAKCKGWLVPRLILCMDRHERKKLDALLAGGCGRPLRRYGVVHMGVKK